VFEKQNTKPQRRDVLSPTKTNAAPIILVPGFWLGAWAWDDVVSILRAEGHNVTALTLPGLESADADRSAITLSDHVDAICEAVTAAGAPVVLAVHSGAGAAGYAASDRIPDQIAAMVYVDSGPATGAMDPDFDAVEKPLVWEEIEKEENLDGLSEDQIATFRERAVPEPAAVLRDAPELTNHARLDVPTTAVATGYTSDEYKAAIKEGYDWLGGFAELRNITWVDLPTSHWPMWSRPQDLAAVIGDVAQRASVR
jgi:pimeloyl-ACP methyl ester carboxylesterase